MNIGAEIVYHHELFFDPADARNGSLYVCVKPGTPIDAVEAMIDGLRDAGLWSREPYKTVPENHRQAYAEQMRFVACARFDRDGVEYLVARYDHPKFPSDAARWSEWLNALAAIATA